MPENYKLTRTGDVLLEFSGDLLAEAGGQWFHGRQQNRWYTLALYRTEGGSWVLAYQYHTQWEGEPGYCAAEVYGDAAGVRDALRCLDPSQHATGYPPHPQYADKQARLMTHLRTQWADAVSDLVAGVADLTERID